MDRKNKEWKEAEDQFLKDHYKYFPKKFLMEQLQRSWGAIRTRAYLLGVTGRRYSKWTDNEIKLLKEFYNIENGLEVLAKELPHRSMESIHSKARSIGLNNNK